MAEILEEDKPKFSEKDIKFTALLAIIMGFLIGVSAVLIFERFVL